MHWSRYILRNGAGEEIGSVAGNGRAGKPFVPIVVLPDGKWKEGEFRDTFEEAQAAVEAQVRRMQVSRDTTNDEVGAQ